MSQLAGAGGAGGVAMSAQEALLQEAASYRRPLSPPSYDGSKHVPAMPQRYTPNHMEVSDGRNPVKIQLGNLQIAKCCRESFVKTGLYLTFLLLYLSNHFLSHNNFLLRKPLEHYKNGIYYIIHI